MNDSGVAARIYESGPPISRGRLALYLWLVCEGMVFVGLLGAFVVARMGVTMWPPAYIGPHDTIVTPPRVDLVFAILNAVVLVVLFIAALRTQHAARAGNLALTRRLVWGVTGLGIAFLAIMAFDFWHEIGRGLNPMCGPYGAYIFVISGVHGLHVLAGVIWQLVSVGRAIEIPVVGGVNAERVEHLGIYWGFVTFMWMILLVLLYIL